MRPTLFLFILCGLGAAIWAEAADRNAEAMASWPGREAPPAVEAGVRALALSTPGLALADFAMGEEVAPGEWSFRARALDLENPHDPALPVWGSAAHDCAAAAGCWRLSELLVDGRPHPAAQAAR